MEGPDGSGKTTQARRLVAHLKEQGYTVYATREPGGTAIGDQIRTILLSSANAEMLPTTEILLYSASRAQIVGEVIVPHLRRGEIVICDRYFDSTLAYQGYGHGLDLDTLRVITDFATGGLKPDLTIYLDVSAELGIQRKAGQNLDRLEQYDIDFHRRVCAGYRELIAADAHRWRAVAAQGNVDAVEARVREIVLETLADYRIEGEV